MSGTRENAYAFYVSSADPDDDPVWVDLTDRVREDELPMMALTGRQNDLDEADPGRFEAQLDNDNDDFTYDNEASPYAAWWGPGRLCQLRETVAGQEFNMFTGYIETPTEVVETATEDGEGDRKRVNITAIDRLGRFGTSEPFVSTLGAQIMGASTSAPLAFYWPLLDENLPPRAAVGTTKLGTLFGRNTTTLPSSGASFSPAGGATIPGDDLPGMLLTLGTGSAASSDSPILAIGNPGVGGGFVEPDGNVTDGDASLLVWVSPELPYDDVVTLATVHLRWGASSAALCTLTRLVSGSDGVFKLDVTGSVTGSITTSVVMGTDRFFLVGFNVIPAAGSTTITLWIDDLLSTASGTGAGGLVTGLACDYASVGGKLQGTVAHLQIYEGLLTQTEVLAQRAVGLSGLHRQTTGERIRTIAQYAGMSESQLELIDDGTAVMQPALLAGKTPLEAMREAENAERGLLYVDGSGRLVFKGRRSLYNI